MTPKGLTARKIYEGRSWTKCLTRRFVLAIRRFVVSSCRFVVLLWRFVVSARRFLKSTRRIAQFRIPGRTGASCVKLIKVRLMRGRNESMRALELVNHCCCALNCAISTQKTKDFEKYPERTNVRCFPIVQDSEKNYYAAEIPERERRMRWIATCSCRLDSLMV